MCMAMFNAHQVCVLGLLYLYLLYFHLSQQAATHSEISLSLALPQGLVLNHVT